MRGWLDQSDVAKTFKKHKKPAKWDLKINIERLKVNQDAEVRAITSTLLAFSLTAVQKQSNNYLNLNYLNLKICNK